MNETGRQWSIYLGYTAYTMVTVLLMLPLGLLLVVNLSISTAFAGSPVLTLLLAAQTILAGICAWRQIMAWARQPLPRGRGLWNLPRAGFFRPDRTLLLVIVPAVAIAVASLGGSGDPRLFLVSIGVVAGVAFLGAPWWVGALVAAGIGALTMLLGYPVWIASPVGAFVLAVVLTERSSLWLTSLVRELHTAREAQARLAVAEERLRFARDLHDVTGRDLSAIAVKAELVAQLVERDDPRSVQHARETAQIARSSLAEIRALVRGYREADLAAELQGTVSLLRSAQASVIVRGDVDAIPAEHAAAAAWVLREGGTNMLRHAAPHRVEIELAADGIRLRNDGLGEGTDVGPADEGAGLTGLRERLADGAALAASADDGTFTLAVRFADQPATAPIGDPS